MQAWGRLCHTRAVCYGGSSSLLGYGLLVIGLCVTSTDGWGHASEGPVFVLAAELMFLGAIEAEIKM